MTKTTTPVLMTKTPSPTERVDDDSDRPMTERTAAELRQLCDEKGERFDTALTEDQARRRILALRDG